MINAKGELVGLIFDGNIQSLPGYFVYDEAVNRAVSVDVARHASKRCAGVYKAQTGYAASSSARRSRHEPPRTEPIQVR